MSDFGKFQDFKNFGDQTIGMANKGLFIEFEHVPTGHKTRFKSLITQFRDDFTSEYNTEYTYGRMDPIQTFKRTGRILSFDFDIPSSSMEEAFENLRRMSLLIQFLYPTYSDTDNATAIQAAPIVRVKFLNFIQSQLDDQGLYGTLSGITFSPDMEAGVYEFTNGPRKIAPKIIKVSCQLTVLHDHALGWKNRSQQKGFVQYPYNLDPFYSNLKKNEPNNTSPPKGKSGNKKVKEARKNATLEPKPDVSTFKDAPGETATVVKAGLNKAKFENPDSLGTDMTRVVFDADPPTPTPGAGTNRGTPTAYIKMGDGRPASTLRNNPSGGDN